MNRTIVNIGESLLDLFAKSIIAITYQIVDVRDLKQRRISFSSVFELPLTPNNRLLLGLPDDIQSDSIIPYQKTNVKCSSNGLEYFAGQLEINSADKTIKTNIRESVIDVFEAIRDKRLYEVDAIDPTAWNAADIDGFRLAVAGVVAPVINWGKFEATPADINATLYLPSYFYSEVVLAILNNTGFTFVGDILTDTDFTELLIPFSAEQFIYVQAYQDERTFNAKNLIPQVFASPVLEKITIDSVVQGVAGWYEIANSRFQIPNFSSAGDIGTANLYFILDVNIEQGTPPIIAEQRFEIRKNGFAVIATVSIMPPDEFPHDYHVVVKAENVAIQDSDYFEVFFFSFNEIPDVVTINAINFYGHVTRIPNRNLLFHNYLLPDKLQTDILADFFVRFGAFVTLEKDGETVTVKTIDGVLKNKSAARDWTNKRVARKDKVAFEYQSYTQNNYFVYEEGDEVNAVIGRGNIPVNNENLNLESEYFKSIFENCNTTPPTDVAINMAVIPVYDGTSATIDDFANEPGLKLLTIRAKSSEEPDVTFNILARNDYRVAYFIDPVFTKDTGFQYFIDNYYSGLMVSFDKTKLIDRDYTLQIDDISNDVMLIYDSGNYFLVNKIPKHIVGEITEGVELLRVF